MAEHAVRPQLPAFERMRTLDAEFLHLEDARSPMHIGGLCIFEGPAPSRDQILRLVTGTLALVPRYHRRALSLPLELGRPVWIDDANFSLDYHVCSISLAAPHDDAALCELMGRLMSPRLDRNRPLWQLFIVDGLSGGRWALIAKIHHSMVDGISGVDLLAALFDKARETPRPAPVPWSPAPQPHPTALVRDAWAGLGRDVRGWAERLVWGVKHPGAGTRDVLAMALGLSHYARGLIVTHPTSSIQGEIGERRRYAFTRARMADLQHIRHAFGCTINDVTLAAVSGGYRALLHARGDRPGDTLVRSLVPASVRGADGNGVFDNRVSAIFCDLPVHLDDPVARLHAVTAQMARMKRSHMVEAGLWFMQMGDLAPPMVVGAVSRWVARAMHRVPQTLSAPSRPTCPGLASRSIFSDAACWNGCRTSRSRKACASARRCFLTRASLSSASLPTATP